MGTRLREAYNSNFGRSVLTLVTGTTIAQAIPVAISPLLTRMYSPESFGVLAIFISVATVINVIANLRYQLSIVQPKEDEDGASLVILSMIIAMIISLFLLVIVHVFNQDIRLFLGLDSIGPWLYLTPVSVLFFGFYQPLNYWYVRQQHFKNIAISKVGQGATGGIAQLAFGSMGIGPLGLITGHIIGQVTALIVLLKSVFNNHQAFNAVTLNKVVRNAARYRKMPQYSAPGAVVDSLSAQIPIFFIVKYYDIVVTGFFGLVFRVLNLPLSLISGSVGQVILQRLAQDENSSEDGPDPRIFILKLFFILLIVILPFVVVMMAYGDLLFMFVFGEQWRFAGEMAGVLVIAVAIRFAVSPLSSVMALERHIRTGVVWQFTYLITISSTLMFFSSYPLMIFLNAFVIHELILYSFYLILILKSVTK